MRPTLNYTITATSSDGSRNITVPASEVDGSTPVNVGGFNDLCSKNYTFTVAPRTTAGTGPMSDMVSITLLNPGMKLVAPR